MKNILIVLFLLLLPFEDKTSVWLNLGGGFNFITIFLILLIIAWIVGRSYKTPIFVNTPLNTPMFWFIGLLYLSTWVGCFMIGSIPFGEQLHAFKRFISPFILFFIIVNSVKDRKTMKLLVHTMIISLIIVAIITIRIHKSFSYLVNPEAIRSEMIDIVGMQSNLIGAFFAQYLPLILCLALIDKNLVKKSIYFSIFVIGSLALMYTYSRGAYVSIIVALFAVLFFGGKKSIATILVFCFIGIAAVGLISGKTQIIPNNVKERFISITEEGNRDRSIRKRRDIWEEARRYIYKSPIFGWGYGASGPLLPMDTHNMYYDIALEAGIPALLLFMLILFRAFKISANVFKISADPFHKALSLGMLGCLGALTVGNIFGTRLDFFGANGYFAVLLGMVTRLHVDLNNNKNKNDKRKTKTKFSR